jgi:hypothetical protein
LLNLEESIANLILKGLTGLKRNSLPENFGSPEALNKKLQRALRIAEDIITYAIKKKIEDPIAFVKKISRRILEIQLIFPFPVFLYLIYIHRFSGK